MQACRTVPPQLGMLLHQVACAVAKKAYENGLATALPKPHSVMNAVKAAMYRSAYRKYR